MGLTSQVTNHDRSIRETGKGDGAGKMVYIMTRETVIVQKPDPRNWEDGGNLTGAFSRTFHVTFWPD
jgi:peptidoglycan hydrolase-like protein with peptidoglycan-binding domain